MADPKADHLGTDAESTPARQCFGWLLSAACMMLALGLGSQASANHRYPAVSSSHWSVTADEAPSYLSESTSKELANSDALFAVQGWRWSSGTRASIAVLVRVESMRSVTLTRIGGLYGP